MNFGCLCWHDSTVRPKTRISVETGCHGPYHVRIRTAGVITYQETAVNETRARELFERIVTAHENGEPLCV